MDLSEALELVEAVAVDQARLRSRLISELDGVLALLSQMLVQHASRADLVADIRERIDSTLDERLRLKSPDSAALSARGSFSLNS